MSLTTFLTVITLTLTATIPTAPAATVTVLPTTLATTTAAVTTAAATTSAADASNPTLINWSLEKSSSPSADEVDAYTRITTVMTAAAARHARLGKAAKNVKVSYTPGVPTAEASFNGDLRFGASRGYMTERTALHEIAHTLGVGQTGGFSALCASGNWPTALPLLRSWDGPDATISCGGGHFWPYGLNYETEMSETNADRHVLIINAMIADGMQN